MRTANVAFGATTYTVEACVRLCRRRYNPDNFSGKIDSAHPGVPVREQRRRRRRQRAGRVPAHSLSQRARAPFRKIAGQRLRPSRRRSMPWSCGTMTCRRSRGAHWPILRRAAELFPFTPLGLGLALGGCVCVRHLRHSQGRSRALRDGRRGARRPRRRVPRHHARGRRPARSACARCLEKRDFVSSAASRRRPISRCRTSGSSRSSPSKWTWAEPHAEVEAPVARRPAPRDDDRPERRGKLRARTPAHRGERRVSPHENHAPPRRAAQRCTACRRSARSSE